MQTVEELLQKIEEDTRWQSNPRTWREHPLMAELVSRPDPELTRELLDRLKTNPSWIITSALWMKHPDDGLEVPIELRGRFTAICELWLKWGERRAS